MKRLVHKLAAWYLKKRIEQIEENIRFPQDTQYKTFTQLIEMAEGTQWGRTYGYKDINNFDLFRQRVPISTYEQFFPFIEKTLQGEENIIWPGKINFFAKSSGTTNDKSKYIPVTMESLTECHYKAGQDMLAMYLHNAPESKLFTGKSLSIGGSHDPVGKDMQAICGDVSAVLLENLPVFYELMRTPSKEVALIKDWDKKVEAMLKEVIYEDVTSIVGVPTWTMVLLNRIFSYLDLSPGEVSLFWPNLEVYFHGGVNFDPYRKQFERLLQIPDMQYIEVYNASEGFFGVQPELHTNELLLMLDYGVYYEFVPIPELANEHPQTLTLDEVGLNTNYALLISTNGGLWRYLIGDTIMFTSLSPYKFKITGRTKQYINVFGEELMVENAERAISIAADATNATVDNFTVAPIYFEGANKGGHEWLIEFTTYPADLRNFIEVLDNSLKRLNSDYEAKRKGDLALGAPLVRILPRGAFYDWMKRKGKLGGQHKVPRLANHRAYVEEILSFTKAES